MSNERPEFETTFFRFFSGMNILKVMLRREHDSSCRQSVSQSVRQTTTLGGAVVVCCAHGWWCRVAVVVVSFPKRRHVVAERQKSASSTFKAYVF